LELSAISDQPLTAESRKLKADLFHLARRVNVANGDYPRLSEDTLTSDIMDKTATGFTQVLSHVMARGLSGDQIILEGQRQQFSALAAAAMAQANQQITANNTQDRILQARAAGGQPQSSAGNAGVNSGTGSGGTLPPTPTPAAA
jgi:hypothetical protein